MTTSRHYRNHPAKGVGKAVPDGVLLSLQAATLRKHLVHHARGAGCDVDLIERGLEALRTKYDTDSDVTALERLFAELEAVGMAEMRRRRAD